MSHYNSNIEDHIKRIIDQNKENITSLLNSGTGESGESFTFRREVEDTYNSPEVEDEIYYVLSFELTYTDKKPHKYQMEDGRYRVKIKCHMDDSSILTTLKEDMYTVSEKYIPYREDVVTQDYPRKEVAIDYDITEEQFKRSFI